MINTQLPYSWEWRKLGNLCTVVRGGSPRPMGDPKYFKGNIPFIKISDITRVEGKFVSEADTKVNEEGSKKSRLLPKGSLVLSNSGTVCVPKFLGTDACIHDGFVSFVNFKEGVDLNFLYHYFNFLRPYVIQKHRQGITQVNLNTEIVRDFDIPLPPLEEQQLIVEKIEELFSELDKGIESFQTALAQLKTYRQALMKSAFEGKFTGGTEGWQDVKLGEVLLSIKAGKSFRCEERPPRINETGVVKVSAVTWGVFNENESKTCFDTSKVNLDYQILEGDFLFSRANTIDLVGACVIVKYITLPLMLSDKILRFEFSDRINKQYALHYLRSRRGRSEIERLATGNQDSMRNIGQDRIKQISTPLPPLEVQEKIIQEIDSRLSEAENMEKSIRESLYKAEALRQSILKKAFEGKLVSAELADVIDEMPKAEMQNQSAKKQPSTYQLPLSF